MQLLLFDVEKYDDLELELEDDVLNTMDSKARNRRNDFRSYPRIPVCA
jgi:hypothetical protein